jgi:hypothetical protein
MATIVAVVMAVAASISARFGRKRAFNFGACRAKPDHHLLDHAVLPGEQQPIEHLDRQMPVSQMVGQPRQTRGPSADLQEWLGSGNDPDDTAIFQCQAVAIIKPGRLFQIQ